MALYIKDGYSSYNEREVFELPVRKLLDKNPGNFAKLTEDTLEFILGYLMEEPSPFNTFRHDLEKSVRVLRNCGLFVVHLDHITIQTPIYRDNPCFEQCHIYCNETLDLILKLGIPAKVGYSLWELENGMEDDEKLKMLELPHRWAAARGPWPEQSETNMCEARLSLCMQCVYESLLQLIRLTIVNSHSIVRKEQLFVAMKSNICFFKHAWDGVGGWRD